MNCNHAAHTAARLYGAGLSCIPPQSWRLTSSSRRDTSDNELLRCRTTHDTILRSPAYDDSIPVHRSYEVALHEFYDREGYWSEPEPPPQTPSSETAQDADAADEDGRSKLRQPPRYE